MLQKIQLRINWFGESWHSPVRQLENSDVCVCVSVCVSVCVCIQCRRLVFTVNVLIR